MTYNSIFSLSTFDKFYELNRDMLLNYKPKDYPINKKAFQKWVKDHKDPQLYKLAKIFYDNTKYVSYKEFMTKLNLIAENLIEKINRDKYTDIVYVMSSYTNKSNFWIGMLIYGIIKDKIKISYLDIDFIDEYLYSKEFYEKGLKNNPNFKFAYIYCDDATYSGEQLSRFIEQIPYKGDLFIVLPYCTEPAIRKLTNKIYHLLKESGKKEGFFDKFFNIQKISDKVNIYLPEKAVFFKSFRQVVKETDPTLLEAFDKNNILDKFMVYFNHKLADKVSIYQTIYALGCNLRNENKKKFDSLITGCNYNNKKLNKEWIKFSGLSYNKSKEKLCSDEFVDLPQILQNKNEMCPQPFYKNFIYKYDGLIINNNEFFNIICNDLKKIEEKKIKIRLMQMNLMFKNYGFSKEEMDKINEKIPYKDLTIEYDKLYNMFELAYDEALYEKSNKFKKSY